MIPIEVGKKSHRRQVFSGEQNAQELAADLNPVDELRNKAQIHEEACKLQASRRYNTRVKPRSFRAGDLASFQKTWVLTERVFNGAHLHNQQNDPFHSTYIFFASFYV
uniref:Uncharacterized protein n=1 Tax=Cajanus cajan TaxID=3821 RepID=A0A151QVT9_CAJCA|nr:hypothetical protein KK1_044595 [Cajanus cajan]